MAKAANALLSIWTWFEIAMVALVGFLLEIPVALVTFPFDRRKAVAGRFFHLAGVVATKLSPFFDFGIHGEVPRQIARRTVFVSNHESQADPFLIAYLPWEMKWLGKKALFKIPLIGWGLWLAGDVGVSRGAHDSVKLAMAACARWLELGMPVVIFPEGTRSETHELLPFKDGAFRLAIETGAEVMPVAVCGTRKAMPKGGWRFNRAKALVSMGTAIPTKGMTLADVERVKAMARAQIEALKAKLIPLVES